jgi:flagellar motor switch/type III secretory pathway protein FliN
VTHSAAAEPCGTPLLLLGEKRRGVLQARLERCVSVWLDEWHAAPSCAFAAELLPIAAALSGRISANTSRVVVGTAGGRQQLCVVTSNAGASAALGIPRFVTMGGDDGLARSMLDRLATSLADSVFTQGHTKGGLVTLSRAPTDDLERLMRREHWWALVVEIGSEQRSVLLAISPALIEQLSPAVTPASTEPVEKRRSAIDDETVRIEAVLGEADVSVGDLASLCVDDVIVLRSGLSQPGYLSTDGGRRIANITVGRLGNKRAVTVTK